MKHLKGFMPKVALMIMIFIIFLRKNISDHLYYKLCNSTSTLQVMKLIDAHVSSKKNFVTVTNSKLFLLACVQEGNSRNNRVAYLVAAENYYVVFIEGVLLQGHSATGIRKHDVLGRCWYVMGKFYIRSR